MELGIIHFAPPTRTQREKRPMQGATKERWLILTEQAVTEKDPDRLSLLVREICELLEQKKRRLEQQRQHATAPLPSKSSE